MAELKLRNINKIYPNGFHAVHDFSMDIHDGEFIALVGPSGCGKSTLLRMIAGLEEISGGEFLIDEKKVNDLAPVDRNVAMVFQDYALYGNLPIYDNVGMSMSLRHADKTEIYDKVMETSQYLNIREYLKRLPGQLSGGQKQRVALARSMVRAPEIFLMDEPLSNLDAKLRAVTRTEIIQVQRKLKTPTVYVTHDQIEAMTMADRIVVMKEGWVQQMGTPMELYNNPVNLFVAGFIGMPPMNFIPVKINNGYAERGNLKFRIPETMLSSLTDYEGKEMIMGIRPEAISITESGEHRLEVITKEFLGANYEVKVKIPGMDVLFTTGRDSDLSDEMLQLHFAIDKAHFFDKETENSVI